MLTVLAGCGTTAKMIAAKSQSERADVFQVMPCEESIPGGYADIVIRLRPHPYEFFLYYDI